MEPVDQFLLQRRKDALHTRVIIAALRLFHALPNRTEAEARKQCPIFMTGIMDAVIESQYQFILIAETIYHIAQGIQGIAAQTGTHVLLYEKANGRPIIAVRHRNKVQTTICTFDLCNIASDI